MWPEPTSSAAGWRILHLVKLFSRLGKVHFCSSASKSEYSVELSKFDVTEHEILLNDSSFDTFINNLNPDVVVFDRYISEEQYGWRVNEICPNALRILDTEDLHFLRQARAEAYKKNDSLNLYTSTAKREIASILRTDLSLVISKKEMDVLTKQFNIPKERLFYIPFQEEPLSKHYILNLPSFDERKNFVFIGNFLHLPNVKTVEVLKRDIWPTLRKLCPGAELHIYGAYASQNILNMTKANEKFYIKSRAFDARDTLSKYRVLIAPIPFGAGTKGKFVDAMGAGTPSVSTQIGQESMNENSEWNGFVTDSMEDFIQKSELLYKNQQVWNESRNKGYIIFEKMFADLSYSEELLKTVLLYKKDIQFIRKSNFISQILLSQQNNASKYMSLWIQEKNKNKSNI